MRVRIPASDITTLPLWAAMLLLTAAFGGTFVSAHAFGCASVASPGIAVPLY